MTTENKLVPIEEQKLILTNKEALTAIKEFEFNYEEIKTNLEAHLENYKNIVYTDEKIVEAKKDQANLNKLSKALDDERKRIQKIYEEPAKEFKKRVDELIALVKEETIPLISNQISAYEIEEKKQKKHLIERFYLSEIPVEDRVEVPLDSIFNDTWLNKTFTMKKVEEEIRGLIAYYKKDIRMIETIGGDYTETLIKKYKECKDLEKVMEYKKQLDDAEKIVKSEIEPVVIEAPASIQSTIPTKEVKEGNTSKVLRITGKDKDIDKFMTVLAKYCFDNRLDVDIIE